MRVDLISNSALAFSEPGLPACMAHMMNTTFGCGADPLMGSISGISLILMAPCIYMVHFDYEASMRFVCDIYGCHHMLCIPLLALP